MLLDTAPGCVLIAVIAPAFVSGNTADLIAPTITGRCQPSVAAADGFDRDRCRWTIEIRVELAAFAR